LKLDAYRRNYQTTEMCQLTSTAQSGCSIGAGTARLLDIGYGLSVLNNNIQ